MAMGQAAQQSGDLITRTVGMGMQRSQNKKLLQQEYEYNKKWGKFQNELALDMWDKTNYAAQIEQMKKAGLNVGLMYGGGGAGGAIAQQPSAGASGAKASDQMPSGGMGMQIGMQAARNQKEMEVLEAQKENINADTANKKAENPNIGKEGANLGTQNQIMELDRQLKELSNQRETETIKDQIASVKAQKEKLEAEARQENVEANVSEATEKEQVKQRGEGATLEQQMRIAAQKSGIQVNEAQVKKMSADITESWSRIEKQWADNKIDKKQLELEKEKILIQKAQQEFNTSTAAQIKQWTSILGEFVKAR